MKAKWYLTYDGFKVNQLLKNQNQSLAAYCFSNDG